MGSSESWPLMGLAGAVVGLILAVGEHFLIGFLRRAASLPLAVVGWAAIALIFALTMNCLYFFAKGEDKSGISFLVASLGVLILLVVGGLAAIHFKRDGIPYWQACGHLMAQFGGAFLLCYGIAQVLPRFVAALPGSAPTEDKMVWWFPHFHLAADWLYGVFLAGVVLLEVLRPFHNLLTKGG